MRKISVFYRCGRVAHAFPTRIIFLHRKVYPFQVSGLAIIVTELLERIISKQSIVMTAQPKYCGPRPLDYLKANIEKDETNVTASSVEQVIIRNN